MQYLIKPHLVLEGLQARKSDLRKKWLESQPFHYLCIDNFLPEEMAQTLLDCYPTPKENEWVDTNYVNQIGKFRSESGFPKPIESFFSLTALPEFKKIMSEITGINDLLSDPQQFGGGMHQILPGGFLDVHIDYNFHPEKKLHRRINLLLYLNKNWEQEYGGYLELWDMDKKEQLENIAPIFNRAILFETNQISYHGHPKPLKCPAPMTRKSLAVYCYTKERDDIYSDSKEHNTIYKNVEGIQGIAKGFLSTWRTISDRLDQEGAVGICEKLLKKSYRKIKGLPPKNM
jgi:Rps23 Pro-64 3,4-dihydroxylase Tpa1-like proline 4-hydroxylase